MKFKSKLITLIFILISNFTFSNEDKEPKGYDHFKYFPILGDFVQEDLGQELPYPFGISYIGNFNKSNIYAKDIKIKNKNMEGISGETNLNTMINGVMLDFYPLPFLNVYGFIADVHIEGDVKANIRTNINNKTYSGSGYYNDDGIGYGYGVNLIVGYDNLFLSLNTSYIINNMDQIEEDKTIVMFNPRLIYRSTKYNFEMWMGAVFLKINEEVDGILSSEYLGDINYSMILDSQESMPIIGVRKEFFAKSVEVMADAMYTSDFYGINIRLGYRF
jgi:hypothetical protein